MSTPGYLIRYGTWPRKLLMYQGIGNMKKMFIGDHIHSIHFNTNEPNKLECGKSFQFCVIKHSNVRGPFLSYGENEVLLIRRHDIQRNDTLHNGRILLCRVSLMIIVLYADCHKWLLYAYRSYDECIMLSVVMVVWIRIKDQFSMHIFILVQHLRVLGELGILGKAS